MKLTLNGKSAITLLMQQEHDYDLCCVELSGRGCRFFESYSNLSFMDLFANILDADFNITRLDLAFDVKSSDYPIELFKDAYSKEFFITRSKCYSMITNSNNGVEGCSLYFGKRDSNFFVNIYDKASERGFKNDELEHNWIRIELRYRHELCNQLVERLLNGVSISQLYFGQLVSKLRFIEPDEDSNDSNKRRWPMAKWYQRLIQDSVDCKLHYPGVSYDYSKWEKSFFQRAGSSLLMYIKMHPDDNLLESLYLRDVRLNPAQQLMVDNYSPGLEWLELCNDDSIFEDVD